VKAGIICCALFFAGVISVMCGGSIHAATNHAWTAQAPTVYKNVPVTDAAPNCVSYVEKRMIVELRVSRSVCMEGSKLRFGYVNFTGSSQVVVEFPYTGEVHMLTGICASRMCRYAPEQDALVTTQQSSQFGVSVTIFKNVSKRVQLKNTDGGPVYAFDTSNPEYMVHATSGKFVATPAFSMSSNGRWVAMEVRDAGLAIVDTETFETKQITTEGSKYGYGMDPSYELAVSDDGKSVAAAGWNAGFRVYDVDDSCGQSLSGNLTLQPGKIHCPYSDFGIGNTFVNFSLAKRPRFFGDGRQLEVIIESWVESPKRVTFLANGSTVSPQLTMLSLGDSFTSGEGETDASRYAIESDVRFACHVSNRAYPVLLASMLHVPNSKAKNVACAGAQMSDIAGRSDAYWGQGNRLGIAGRGLTRADAEAAQELAVENFEAGQALQSSFVERYDPELITVGVGGNDAGLMGKLRACAMPGTCEWATEEGKRKSDDEIFRLSGTLEAFYGNLKDRAANARILIVGYPQVIEPEGTCDAVTATLLNADERKYMSESLAYLNGIIKTAAARAGVMYADVDQSYGNKKLCGSSKPFAMNGVRIGDDVALIAQIPVLKVVGSETFHPTPIGHALVANEISVQHPNLLTETMPAPNQLIQTPAVPHALTTNTARSFSTSFATVTSDRAYQIALKKGSVQPGAEVKVEVHSEPLLLATLYADDEGAVNGNVVVPPNVGDGFHTLHVLTLNISHAAVDLYQFVTIGGVEDTGAPHDKTFYGKNIVSDGTKMGSDRSDAVGADSLPDASVLEAISSNDRWVGATYDSVVKPLEVLKGMKKDSLWYAIGACVVAVAATTLLIVLITARKRSIR